MALRFSDRIGKTKPKTELLKEGLSEEAANSLWSVIYDYVSFKSNKRDYNKKYTELSDFYRLLWVVFFKRPVDTITYFKSGQVNRSQAISYVRGWYFDVEWYDKLNLVEFIFGDVDEEWRDRCNLFLKNEFSAYRFVDNIIVEINSKEEIVEIEKALNIDDKFRPIKTHLSTALKLLSDKKSPDYRNSIKESISAVEALAGIIIGNGNLTLGQALKEVDKKHKLPGSLKSAFSKLYGYTSGESGIRHALLEEDYTVDIEEARFMLVACSAFVNYLVAKM